MARARTVWVVTNHNHEPLGAWTVKYECQNYLQMSSPYKDQWRVWAFRDGEANNLIKIYWVSDFLDE